MQSGQSSLSGHGLKVWYFDTGSILKLTGEKILTDSNLQKRTSPTATKSNLLDWLNKTNPPTLGQLFVSNDLKPETLFSHHSYYYCKGLPQVSVDLEKKRIPTLATAYSYLLDFQPNQKLHFQLHHDHLTSHLSWKKLSGRRKNRFVILGTIKEATDYKIEAVPLVIATPTGKYWPLGQYVHLDDIDEFSLIRKIPPTSKNDKLVLERFRDISEATIRQAFAEIISGQTKSKNSTRKNLATLTSQLHLSGEPISAAFAFKGTMHFNPLTLQDLGDNGHQISRLFGETAGIFILQHCHQVTIPVSGLMRAYAQRLGRPSLFCVINGYDTVRLLQAYKKCGF